jgi:hypothetical protein
MGSLPHATSPKDLARSMEQKANNMGKAKAKPKVNSKSK